jgi:hypothetical protein
MVRESDETAWNPARPYENVPMPAPRDYDALLLCYARQAENLGMSPVALLNEALLAELEVQNQEKRLAGEPLRPELFGRATLRHQTRSDLDDETRRALERLPELLRTSPHALSSPRVRGALEWLRVRVMMHEDKDVLETTRWLPRLLRRIGQAISDPKKLRYVSERRRDKRRAEVLNVFEWAQHLPSDKQEDLARGLRFNGWNNMQRTVLAMRRGIENERRASALHAVRVERAIRDSRDGHPDNAAHVRAVHTRYLGFESWEELCRFAEAAPERTRRSSASRTRVLAADPRRETSEP